jgi:hypothetical protein
MSNVTLSKQQREELVRALQAPTEFEEAAAIGRVVRHPSAQTRTTAASEMGEEQQ